MVTMLSFWFFGAIPVAGYAIIDAAGVDNKTTIFLVDCVVTLFTMFALGAVKAKVTNTNMLGQGCLMMLNGTIACGAGYFIAWAVAELMGNPEGCR
jgi:VIT1/CCC1 family predicted Fe2+/Mn2+ transporter